METTETMTPDSEGWMSLASQTAKLIGIFFLACVGLIVGVALLAALLVLAAILLVAAILSLPGLLIDLIDKGMSWVGGHFRNWVKPVTDPWQSLIMSRHYQSHTVALLDGRACMVFDHWVLTCRVWDGFCFRTVRYCDLKTEVPDDLVRVLLKVPALSVIAS